MSARKRPPGPLGEPFTAPTLPEQIDAARSLIRIARELHAKADHDLAIADTGLADIAAQLARANDGAS
ncbi:MAG TPA: hypothetical protein VGI10_02160 [Polyangiaceae bacterium]